ncbi:MAG: pantetheine-phosphate adenylyltransferase [Ilumatobacteraceae bacterium]
MIALYPGSFDPIHLGHVDTVEQAASLFGEVVVAVIHNPEKPIGFFSIDERVALAEAALIHVPGVRVKAFAGLAIDAAASVQANCIVKSARNAGDFEIEQQMANTNYSVSGFRTVVMLALPGHGFISSRYIREIAAHGGDVSTLVPVNVDNAIRAKHR